jgi:type I restriction enzyme R subunit
VGKARGLVVVRSRKHCVLFQEEMKKQMMDRNLPYSCLVAFSGVIHHNGRENTESLLNQENGIEGNDIPSSFKDPRYRLLIVSSKFQTGFDEPLLYAMYVDKKLGGVQCVQTLTRLNRTKTGKRGTFVLDFANDTEDVVNSFQPYYTTTELVGETEPDKLYDLEYKIEQYGLFTQDHIDRFCVEFYKKTETDETLHPIIDEVVDNWRGMDSEEKKDEFKSDIQSFCRLYSYIAQIASFTEVRWEKLYVFLRFLNKKLPKKEGSPITLKDDVDLESLRIQFISDSKLSLEVKKGELDPIEGGSSKQQEEDKELLSEIIKRVNDVFGVELTTEDKLDITNVEKRLEEHEELKSVMYGNNSEDAKKDFFNSLVKESFTDYYSDRLDFYKKVMNPKILPMLLDGMYQEFRKGLRL